MYGKTLGGICGLQMFPRDFQWKQSKENAETPIMVLLAAHDDVVNLEKAKKVWTDKKFFERKNFKLEVMDIGHYYTEEQFEKIKIWMD